MWDRNRLAGLLRRGVAPPLAMTGFENAPSLKRPILILPKDSCTTPIAHDHARMAPDPCNGTGWVVTGTKSGYIKGRSFPLMHAVSFGIKIMATVATFATFGSVLPSKAQITFTRLSGMRAPTGVSDNGAIAVGNDDGSGRTGLRWTQSTGAVPLSSSLASPTAISADGSVIVGVGISGFRIVPIRWTLSEGVTPLNPPFGSIDSRALAVSGDGTIAAGFTSFSGQITQATRWVGAQPEALPFLPGGTTNSQAFALSTDGSTIVGYAGGLSAGNVHAVRWTEDAGISDLGAMGGFNSVATGVSSDGSLIVGYIVPTKTSTEVTGFISTIGGMTTELSLLGQSVIPRGISADGKFVIGHNQDDGGPLHGFFWTPGSGVRDLSDVLTHEYDLTDQLGGWTGLYATTMSSDGRFVGGGGFYNGTLEGWLLDRGIDPPSLGEGNNISPVPEPGVYSVAASFLLLGLATLKWRQRSNPKSAQA